MKIKFRNPWHPLRRRKARQQIAQQVAEAERNTAAEIVVRIRERFDPGLAWCHDREERLLRQAKADFILAGADRTKAGTGVILLVVLEERAFTVWAESRVFEALGNDAVEHSAELLERYFPSGRFVLGIGEVILFLGERLSRDFPRQDGDVNELSDGPVVG